MHQILKGGNVKQKRTKHDANALLNEDCFECYVTTVTFFPFFQELLMEFLKRFMIIGCSFNNSMTPYFCLGFWIFILREQRLHISRLDNICFASITDFWCICLIFSHFHIPMYLLARVSTSRSRHSIVQGLFFKLSGTSKWKKGANSKSLVGN